MNSTPNIDNVFQVKKASFSCSFLFGYAVKVAISPMDFSLKYFIFSYRVISKVKSL